MIAQAIDASPDLLLLVLQPGPAGLIVASANAAFCRRSGADRGALEGMRLADLLAVEGDAGVPSALDAAMTGAPCPRLDLRCRGVDAAFVFQADVLRGPDGGPGGLVLLGRDATAQIRQVEQQRAAQALLATVFVSVPVAVAVVGEDGRCQMTNPAFDRMTGFAAGEMIGRPTIDLVAATSRETVMRANERQIADGGKFTITVDTIRKDGSIFSAETSSVLVRGGFGGKLPRVRILILRSAAAVDQPAAPVLVAGRVRLIGLSDVKAELGDRWPALAQRALATAEHVIRKRLAAADTFAPTEDEGFLICFASASEEEASFRAGIIGREIRQRLIGGGATPAVAHVTAIAEAVPVLTPEPPATLESTLAAHLDARLTAVQDEARIVIAETIRAARCQAEPIFGRGGGAVAELVRLPWLEGMRLHAAAAALPEKDAAELDLDGLVLRLADTRARSEAMHRASTPILVNVGFDPFMTAARTQRYLAACRTLAPAVQQRLILLLTNFPPDLARLRVEDCILRLRPFCRAVGFEVDELQIPPVEQAAAGGTIVAIPAACARLVSSARSTQLSGFIAALAAKRCKLLVRGVPNADEAERLRALGVELVSFDEPAPG